VESAAIVVALHCIVRWVNAEQLGFW